MNKHSLKVSVDLSVCERYGHCCFEAPTVFELEPWFKRL